MKNKPYPADKIALAVLALGILFLVASLVGCGASYESTATNGETQAWEVVEQGTFRVGAEKFYSFTCRMKVPGGWLYRTTTGKNAESMCFVPYHPEKE